MNEKKEKRKKKEKKVAASYVHTPWCILLAFADDQVFIDVATSTNCCCDHRLFRQSTWVLLSCSLHYCLHVTLGALVLNWLWLCDLNQYYGMLSVFWFKGVVVSVTNMQWDLYDCIW